MQEGERTLIRKVLIISKKVQAHLCQMDVQHNSPVSQENMLPLK